VATHTLHLAYEGRQAPRGYGEDLALQRHFQYECKNPSSDRPLLIPKRPPPPPEDYLGPAEQAYSTLGP
jgi:hypothetical protein